MAVASQLQVCIVGSLEAICHVIVCLRELLHPALAWLRLPRLSCANGNTWSCIEAIYEGTTQRNAFG